MNHVLSTTSGAFGEGIAAFVGKAVTATLQIGERISLYRQYRTTVVELSKLTSRELADLGLSGSNIKATAYEAVYG